MFLWFQKKWFQSVTPAWRDSYSLDAGCYVHYVNAYIYKWNV